MVRVCSPRIVERARLNGCTQLSGNQSSGTRVMPVCLAMGEAAGIAAAHAAALDKPDVRAVDVPHLRARLREEGGYLPE